MSVLVMTSQDRAEIKEMYDAFRNPHKQAQDHCCGRCGECEDEPKENKPESKQAE